MKISKDKKKENKIKIINSAVDLISEKGFKPTTMRAIAKKAQMGEATIYNYFPTKEAILYAYYEDHMHACIDSLKQVDDFHTYSLQEQLQVLFNTSLVFYLADREFVCRTFRKVLLGSSQNWSKIRPIRDTFLAAVNDMVSAASEAGEIPEQIFQDLIGQFLMDAYIGTIHYWTNDTSESFTNTTVLVDKGLDVACALLKAGVANKLFDITSFLFKTHIFSRLECFVDTFKNAQKIKRKFMEDGYES